MKKVLLFVVALVLSLSANLQTVSAGPSINQRYTGGTQHTTLADTAAAQTFMPSVSGLSYVEIQLTDTNPNEKINVAIRHRTGNVWDAGRLAWIANITPIDGWNVIDFPDLTVTIDDTYGIFVTVSGTDPIQTSWYYSDLQGTYPRGNAYFIYNDNGDGLDMANGDMNFKTYGTTPVEIVEEQTNPGSDQDPEQTGVTESTSTTSTGSAPATQTTTSIKPPTKLTASFDSSAQLAWNASTTTDIDGYIIFRSETIGKNYAQVGKTIKSVIDYSDKTVIAGKTYYYIVRAYKGTGQSANSNEATVTIPENAVIATDTETAVPTSDIQTTANRFGTTFWILVGIDFALILVLLFLMIRRHYKQKKN